MPTYWRKLGRKSRWSLKARSWIRIYGNRGGTVTVAMVIRNQAATILVNISNYSLVGVTILALKWHEFVCGHQTVILVVKNWEVWWVCLYHDIVRAICQIAFEIFTSLSPNSLPFSLLQHVYPEYENEIRFYIFLYLPHVIVSLHYLPLSCPYCSWIHSEREISKGTLKIYPTR